MISRKTMRSDGARSNNGARKLDLRALRETPGFMVKLLQLRFFEVFRECFAKLNLTPASYAILLLVRENPGVSTSSVASALQVHAPNLTKLLNGLDKAGLIERRRSQTDGRAVELILSKKGMSVVNQAVDLMNSYNEKVLVGLKASERSRFLQMLKRVIPG